MAKTYLGWTIKTWGLILATATLLALGSETILFENNVRLGLVLVIWSIYFGLFIPYRWAFIDRIIPIPKKRK